MLTNDEGSLIENLNEPADRDKDTLLLPDFQPTPNQKEPNYDEMDNLTLLSSLCLQSESPSTPLLPELD